MFGLILSTHCPKKLTNRPDHFLSLALNPAVNKLIQMENDFCPFIYVYYELPYTGKP